MIDKKAVEEKERIDRYLIWLKGGGCFLSASEGQELYAYIRKIESEAWSKPDRPLPTREELVARVSEIPDGAGNWRLHFSKGAMWMYERITGSKLEEVRK